MSSPQCEDGKHIWPKGTTYGQSKSFGTIEIAICNNCLATKVTQKGEGYRIKDTVVELTRRSTKWRVHNVSGKPYGTIGYAEGNQMHLKLANKLAELEEANKEAVVNVNIVSETTAFIVTKEVV